MEKPGSSLPELSRVDLQQEQTLKPLTDVLRQSPAMRTLGEMVRADDELFEKVAENMARRAEFRKEYDRPGRNVAPWFAAVSRHNPDLLDTALDAHFRYETNKTKQEVAEANDEEFYAYMPILVIGSGPQSQVLVSEFISQNPQAAQAITVIDKTPTVGGTFRDIDAMNFRLNSRTRTQTDEAAIPGTKANLNTLVPGIMALPDITTETYAPADTLGRTNRKYRQLPLTYSADSARWLAVRA